MHVPPNTKPPLPQGTNFSALGELEVSLNIKTDLGRKALRQAIANVVLLDQKNQDYGSANLKIWGSLGVLVRLGDKISRLNNLLDLRLFGPTIYPKNESISVSWADAANYALIGQILDSEELIQKITIADQ